jgi:tetratricopeptide (TPR) repeat protein
LTLGRTEDALAAFRAALQADETSGPARFGEGMALERLGHRRAAIRAFEQLDVASGASPTAYHVEARLRLARLYATCAEPDLRDPARAAELIDDVLRRRGDRDADVLLALAAIRAAGGFPAEAAEAAERAGRLATSETARRSALDLAELYRGGGTLLEDCEK